MIHFCIILNKTKHTYELCSIFFHIHTQLTMIKKKKFYIKFPTELYIDEFRNIFKQRISTYFE